MPRLTLLFALGSHLLALISVAGESEAKPRSAPQHWSGIYPHLAFFNNEGECGTGAVVPFAGRLWAVTYAPHMPRGSSDKLYEITPDLRLIVRPESIGGTPANRMIHRETNQLVIGPYVIDAERNVRVIPYSQMFGRPTGCARHLTEPESKIYIASMEEALYEVDLRSLEVTPLYYDEAVKGATPKADLPGYHGKGLYSGQGRVIYANNGEHGAAARQDPFVPSGVLAAWDGNDWQVVLRKQFTEVTGPGGIEGNPNPGTDPVWSIGWDAKSLILMVLDDGTWHRYRLPKASHSYDGAHGWNTEWPRIRDIGEDDLLMTMHGMFWRFPKGFRPGASAGIAPRSSYLKVIGDFCRWRDNVVFGCDDAAKNEFLNTRKAKGHIEGPQSQSNLWFLSPSDLDALGPTLGRGAVWLSESVAKNEPSDAFLFEGFPLRSLHLTHETDTAAEITIEVDRKGDGTWERLRTANVAPHGTTWVEFEEDEPGVWLRLRSDVELRGATAWFSYRDRMTASDVVPQTFSGLARPGDENVIGGVIRARGGNKRTLHYSAVKAKADGTSEPLGLYVLDANMNLVRTDDPGQLQWLNANAAIPSRAGVIEVDTGSIIYTNDDGRRFRLPIAERACLDGTSRLDREVATERDLFNVGGTFFELPARNAGGFARVRPVASHKRALYDYCSYRGLFVVSGIDLEEAGDNRHVIRSDDGQAALWVGAIDDVWKLGKPVGEGGPWTDVKVQAGAISDPYLFCGYDRKTLTLTSSAPTTITCELDITGTGQWVDWKEYKVDAGEPITEQLPDTLQAYWVRFRTSEAAKITTHLRYE